MIMNKKLDISDQNKIDNLVECFESLCIGEKSDHIICSLLLFLVRMHRTFAFNDVPLEDHAENLKETFINLNKSFDDLESK